jgi:Common central domain of tyrosinase
VRRRRKREIEVVCEEAEMALGDGIRRNVATVSAEERDRFRDAIIALNQKFFPGDSTDFPAGHVSYWFKQDEIHQATHVHGGPAFLPWHRELCNRFEAMLREVDPELSLHYWDWSSDPAPLFTASFMGSSAGDAGEPWLSAGFYDPTPVGDQYRDNNLHSNPFTPTWTGHYELHSNPADPPINLIRNKAAGAPPIGTQFFPSDNDVLSQPSFPQMRDRLELVHNSIHGYINGTIGNAHTSFRDPFVFLLHSNVDRLFAMWQTDPAHPERLDPNQVYGAEGLDPSITDPLQPWAGTSDWPVRPWYPPENEQVAKSSKHATVVAPPCYDTLSTFFAPVYAQGDPGVGIGGFDLASVDDRAFAFDYNSSGRLDHLVLYRPGTGTIWILKKNPDGSFEPVYAQGDPGAGIGGFDLKSPNDLAFAFDYHGARRRQDRRTRRRSRQDHLVLYRPGTGTIWILRKCP